MRWNDPLVASVFAAWLRRIGERLFGMALDGTASAAMLRAMAG
jgi:hypothetical protein